MTQTVRFAQALGIATALCLTIGNGAFGQAFPAKPIRIVVPFPAGGPSDFAARTISPQLSDLWGKPVIVDNRSGASGAIAAEIVAKSPPDGYTLLIATVGILCIAPHLGKLSYDVGRDFAPITNLMGGPLWMLTHYSVPVKDIKGLIALAKAKPGELNYATSGVGQAAHLTGEMFKSMAGGIDMLAVHYKGAAPALTDLLGGQVSMYLASSPTDVMQFVKTNRLRMLAVTSPQRSPATPDVPTMHESGLTGFEVITWNGILAPAATPRDIVARLNRDIVATLQQPKVKERVVAQALLVIGDTPEQFESRIRAESDKWGRVIKQQGIKLE